MAELELVGLDADGEHVVLSAADGQQYRLRIDEPLRAAVRRDRPHLESLRASEDGALSPREIQSRIRSGATAEQVAEESGMALEHVRRYEGPVIDERAFVAEQARATRVGREADTPVLGELVTNRLATRGVEPDSVAWDAFRGATGAWTVVVRFTVGAGDLEARWTFDPAARTLHAEDDESRWLSETEIADSPLPRRHLSAVREAVFDVDAEGRVRPALAAVDAAPEPEPDPGPEGTDALLAELGRLRGTRQAVDLPADDEEDFEGFGPPNAFDLDRIAHTPALDPDDVPGAHPVEVGTRPEGLRSESPRSETPRREPAVVQAVPAPPVEPAPRPTIAAAPDPAPVDGAGRDDDRPRGGGRRTRAKMPSWDEIVFGAKQE